MSNKIRVKRQGVEYIDGGGAASLSVGDDMQHYSDLLDASAKNIESLMIINDVSDMPKLTTALNTAYQNIRWIATDLDKYVAATFATEGVRIAPLPVAKIGAAIVALNKQMSQFQNQFASQAVTIAAIRKQVKAQTKPIIDMLSEYAEEYDMYAGMASTIADRAGASPADIKELGDAVRKAYYELDKFAAKHGDARSTITNRSVWDVDSKNIGPINNLVFSLESKVKVYADPSSKRYIKNPAIAGAIQGYLLACKRLHGADSAKYWDILNTTAVALERLKNAV